MQEIKETGSLSTRVLAVYWKAWGSTMGFIVLLSLILMQVSRNFSDAWLAHWIRSIDTSNTTLNEKSTLFETDSYPFAVKDHVICFLLKVLTFHNPNECAMNETENLTQEQFYASQNGYYLSIYIGIAVFNSIISLIRAIAFAYGGVKAAKFIHDRLLNSVTYVCIALVS